MRVRNRRHFRYCFALIPPGSDLYMFSSWTHDASPTIIICLLAMLRAAWGEAAGKSTFFRSMLSFAYI